MASLQWNPGRPLDNPVLVASFSGWNDAGQAASQASEVLSTHWAAVPVGYIDSEPFLVFQDHRPTIRRAVGGIRQIDWPLFPVSLGRTPNGNDVVFLTGPEPQLHWRTFCSEVLSLVSVAGIRLVVTIGSLLAEVPHTRPVPIYGSAEHPDVQRVLHVESSQYEGQTGVIGVLGATCEYYQVPFASFWAAVPSYVNHVPSPPAALALVQRVASVCNVSIHAPELVEAGELYCHELSELVVTDPNHADYVAQLEREADSRSLADESASAFVEAVERFLQDW